MSIFPLNFDGMSRKINILPLFKLVGEHLLIPFAKPSHCSVTLLWAKASPSVNEWQPPCCSLSVLRYSLNCFRSRANCCACLNLPGFVNGRRANVIPEDVYRLEVTNKVDGGQVGVEFYINTHAIGNPPYASYLLHGYRWLGGGKKHCCQSQPESNFCL